MPPVPTTVASLSVPTSLRAVLARRRRSFVAALSTLALALPACGAHDDLRTAAPATPPPTAADAPAESDPPEPAVDEPSPIPASARAVVSPTGVPVAVVDHTPEAAIVRTPCGNAAPLARGRVIEPVTVVLDPGHGGPVDTGTIGANGLTEADLNLRVAEVTEETLEARGISAALTRTGDYATPLSVRAQFADAAGADLLVSLHHNAPASAASTRPGTEVFVQSASAESQRLGGLLYEEMVAALSRFDVAWTSRHDAGVLRVVGPDGTDVYGMIRRPVMPAALLELGYLANPAEAALFATTEYAAAAATAVADAVEAYLTTDRPGSGHVATPRTFTPRGSRASQDCTDPVLG